jgi:hypothetical protein
MSNDIGSFNWAVRNDPTVNCMMNQSISLKYIIGVLALEKKQANDRAAASTSLATPVLVLIQPAIDAAKGGGV